MVNQDDEEMQGTAKLRISRHPLQCLLLIILCHFSTAKFRSTGGTVTEENIVIRGLRLNDFDSVGTSFRCVYIHCLSDEAITEIVHAIENFIFSVARLIIYIWLDPQ